MDSSGSAIPHVLALPFLLPGHLSPMLHLCKRLASSGCKVTLLKVPENDDEAGKSEWDNGVEILSFLSLPKNQLHSAITDGDLHAILQRELNTLEHFCDLGDVVMRILKDLGPVTCIISDLLVEFAHEVANRQNVSWIPLWTSTAAELAIYYHMPQLISQGVFPFADEQLGKDNGLLITSIPGLPPLRPADYPTLGFIKLKPLCAIIHRLKGMIQHLPKAEMVLVNSVFELENGPIEAMSNVNKIKVTAVGPLHLLSGGEIHNVQQEPVLGWLDRKQVASVLYIAFGTTMPMPLEQIKQVALALESTKQAFVWVLRQNSASLLPSGFEQDMANNDQGLIVSWVPQLAVLKHTSVGGFFTHCGWNSVMESISANVPMITRPISADQVLTARFLVKEWGIALGMKELGASKEEIETLIKAIMSGPEGAIARKKCCEIAELVIGATKHGGSSMTNIELLLQRLQIK